MAGAPAPVNPKAGWRPRTCLRRRRLWTAAVIRRFFGGAPNERRRFFSENTPNQFEKLQ